MNITTLIVEFLISAQYPHILFPLALEAPKRNRNSYRKIIYRQILFSEPFKLRLLSTSLKIFFSQRITPLKPYILGIMHRNAFRWVVGRTLLAGISNPPRWPHTPPAPSVSSRKICLRIPGTLAIPNQSESPGICILACFCMFLKSLWCLGTTLWV